MDVYDKNLAPRAFGQNNTGVICYFNAFLQALASCTAFSKGVLLNTDYLRRTATGTAIINFVSAYATLSPDGTVVAREHLADGIEFLSAAVLRALISDLAVRRPNVRFGGSQESASEALIHLLDMMEPVRAATTPAEAGVAAMSLPDSTPAIDSAESPITSIFLHRFRCDVYCPKCKGISSKTTDHAVNFNLYHLDRLREQPTNVAEFSKAVRHHKSKTEGYCCPACPCATCGATPVDGKCPTCNTAAPTTAIRVYNLTMVPEVVFCMFNLYVEYGGARRARYFPERLEFPAHDDDGLLNFRLVAQVEHSGSLSGGHYWAHGLRAGDCVYRLNDTGVSPTSFAPTSNTYFLVYHYAGRRYSTTP